MIANIITWLTMNTTAVWIWPQLTLWLVVMATKLLWAIMFVVQRSSHHSTCVPRVMNTDCSMLCGWVKSDALVQLTGGYCWFLSHFKWQQYHLTCLYEGVPVVWGWYEWCDEHRLVQSKTWWYNYIRGICELKMTLWYSWLGCGLPLMFVSLHNIITLRACSMRVCL